MKKKSLSIKGMSVLTAIILILTTLIAPAETAGAASIYISVKDFSGLLLNELKGQTAESGTGDDNVAALITKGIIKEGDFASYDKNITRGDAMVLLNRADEYLNGNITDDTLVQKVIAKRISDIGKIPEAKRVDVAKAYIKGYMKGYSNGYYRTNRNLKLTSKITRVGAISCIKLINNKSGRAKISPDGQLIRTTNLPKNADKYDYILACYPNKFYERQFEFMLHSDWKTDTDDWAYPVEMKNETFKNWYNSWPLSQEMDKHLYEWADMAEKYLQYVFNVDYRTVDDNWIEGLGAMYAQSNCSEADDIKTYYIDKMKANHVVVESAVIDVEPSSFYEDGYYCMRAYVKYRITADDINAKQNKLIYAQYPNLINLKNGKWREGIFDIRFSTNNGSSGDGSDFAIDEMTRFVDE